MRKTAEVKRRLAMNGCILPRAFGGAGTPEIHVNAQRICVGFEPARGQLYDLLFICIRGRRLQPDGINVAVIQPEVKGGVRIFRDAAIGEFQKQRH